MLRRGLLHAVCVSLVCVTSTAYSDSVTLTLEYRTDTLEWDLFALINDNTTGNTGDFGLAAVRALLDNISFGANGDAVTLASGIGAINPIAVGTPNERPAVLQTTGGTIDIIYAQDIANPGSVVGGVGIGTRALIMSGSFPLAATPPAFGNDDSGFITDGNFLNVAAPGPFGFAVPWYGAAAFNVTNVTPAGGLGGDYNGSGTVDLADYTVWRDNLGGADMAFAAGSRNPMLAGVIATDDYTFWKNQFGMMSGPGVITAAIPEPGSVTLASIALVMAFVRFVPSRKLAGALASSM